jgi:hypothetical protein
MKAIDHVLADRRLLGAGLGPPESWTVWLTALKAAFERPLLTLIRHVILILPSRI